MAQKKCSSCESWNQQDAKKCSNCGELIDRKKARFERLKKEGKLPKKMEPGPLFEVKSHYPWWKKTLFYVIRPIYWTFFFIVSFILYLIAWVAA